MALEGRELLSTTWTVTSLADDGSAGTLRSVIGHANLTAGVNYINLAVTGMITLTQGQLELSNRTSGTDIITGPGASLLSISGNDASRVFQIEPSVVALITGLTITGGHAPTAGGGILNYSALYLDDCTISDNSAPSSGGLNNYGGYATLTNCTISGNSSSAEGGGLENFDGILTLINCTVSGNSAGTWGGGVENFGDTDHSKGNVFLTNCTVSGNSAGAGGGLFNFAGARATLFSCTVSGNSATSGGGIYDNVGLEIALVNTIVAGQKAGGDIVDPSDVTTGDYNLIGDGSGIRGGVGNLLGSPSNPINPLLAPLGEYGGPTATMALLPGSPAKGAGTTTEGAAATDQRGFSRTGGVEDIGAFQQAPSSALVVDDLTDDVGTSPGHLSLRQALDLAAVLPMVDTITFDPADIGTTPQKITLTQGPLALTDLADMTINGPGANLLTVSGDGKSGVFDIEGGSAALSGLTVSGGQGSNGGGVYHDGGTLSLTGCTMSGNSATYSGGGLFNYGTLSVTNCTVSGNSTGNIGDGGGLFNRGTLTMTDCTVSGNSTGNLGGGGGLFNRGTLTVTDCTVSGNSASGTGGGVFNDGGTATIANCTISGGQANNGGGLFNYGAVATLTNCTISGNSATADGGGLTNYGVHIDPTSSTFLINCTVTGNSAPNGGGLFNYGNPYVSGSNCTITLTNTLIAGQKGGADIRVENGSVTGSYNLIGDGSGISGGTGNLLGSPSNPINPLLTPLGDYGGPTQTIALLPGSPAIGGGTTAGAPANDQRGASRSGRVDIGAFQSEGLILTLVAGSSGQSAPINTEFANPLAVTVTAVNPDEPVNGGIVSFAVTPVNGASATLSAATALIQGGQAGITVTANTTLGSYTVTATAAGVTNPASFALNNAASLNLVAQPVAAVAGQAFVNVVLATFTGTNANASPSDFAAAIIWGDGITTASTTVVADGQGRFDVLGTHTYVDAGKYTFHVQVTPSSGPSATAASTATVITNANTKDPGLLLTTPHDVVLEFHNLASLRAAIAYANSHPGPDTIIFDPAFFSIKRHTIRLTGGPLVLTDPATTTIIGPGARLLALKGNGKSRIFDVRRGSLALSGLSVTGGHALRGGGIRNDDGTLWLTDVIIRKNSASRSGGGLFNSGTATLADVVVQGNHARTGRNLANFGTLSLTRVSVPGNSARLGPGLLHRFPKALARRWSPQKAQG
jgi:hypothetical protein